MNLVVVGTGYVGLVSGVCLAAKGHHVTCIDVNPKIVEMLNQCKPHIYERDLPELLTDVINSGNFVATTDLFTALSDTDLVLVAVGTPSENGVIDLSYIKNVSKSIGDYMRTNDHPLAVVIKSTVVPGTTDTVVKQEIELASAMKFPEFGLGMNPEFLREGEAIQDFMEPDRIVLGYEDERTLKLLEELYEPWSCDKVRVNTRTAELIKYANNALLATQISAINEIANVAAAIGGIDTMDVVNGVTLDKRWNPIINGKRANPEILTYLIPGCGFGGSCFPKDVQALRSLGVAQGLDMHLLNSVLDINDAQPIEVVNILERHLGDLTGKHVLILGLAFKPDTDDVRESASLKIINRLSKHGVSISAHDPIAIDNFREKIGDVSAVEYVIEWEEHVASADIVIIATKWAEYASLAGMNTKGKLVFDARRMFEPSIFVDSKYFSIGLNLA